jgi:hypothetical protein
MDVRKRYRKRDFIICTHFSGLDTSFRSRPRVPGIGRRATKRMRILRSAARFGISSLHLRHAELYEAWMDTYTWTCILCPVSLFSDKCLLHAHIKTEHTPRFVELEGIAPGFAPGLAPTHMCSRRKPDDHCQWIAGDQASECRRKPRSNPRSKPRGNPQVAQQETLKASKIGQEARSEPHLPTLNINSPLLRTISP